MDRAAFEREMLRALALRETGDRVPYWTGFERGLRRAFHGERFGTADEHRRWLSLTRDRELERREKGRGYRDGLRAALERPE